MSENLSSGSGSENLVSPPARQSRPMQSPAPATPAARPVAAQPPAPEQKGPLTADDMKLSKSVKINKPLSLKGGKKKD